MTQAIEIIKREPLELLADRLGFHDLMSSQITAWRRDLLDALRADKVCPKCPGVKGCSWQGLRPSAYLEGIGLSVSLVVRYCRCGAAEELHAETVQKRRWDMARIPEKFGDASLENFRTQGTHQDCRKLKGEILEALLDGHSLVLASKTKGNGKTHLAVVFARERLKAGKTVLFWTVKDLLDEAKKSFDDKDVGDPLGEAQSVDVLVLDDLGMQHTRDWGYSELAGLINYRYNHQLQMLVTTNFAHPKNLADSMGEQGERIASRLKEMAYWIVSQAPDYRSRGRQKRLGA